MLQRVRLLESPVLPPRFEVWAVVGQRCRGRRKGLDWIPKPSMYHTVVPGLSGTAPRDARTSQPRFPLAGEHALWALSAVRNEARNPRRTGLRRCGRVGLTRQWGGGCGCGAAGGGRFRRRQAAAPTLPHPWLGTPMEPAGKRPVYPARGPATAPHYAWIMQRFAVDVVPDSLRSLTAA
jgi:hypothetical protein